MSRPVVSDFTERLYAALPEFMRDADEAQASGGGWPLLRWLSLLGDQAGAVEILAARVEAGELVSATLADDAWLPWLAQMVGARLDMRQTPATWRAAITNGAAGWQSGTREAIATAARRVLTGTQFVAVYDHDGRPTTGDPWTILILVRPEEAPVTLDDVAQAVIDAGAKPAGFDLHVNTFSATWAAIDGAFGDWGSTDNKPWWQVDSTGL